MDGLQAILQRIGYTGTMSEKTEHEIEQFKADSFNGSPGVLNEADGYNCDVCHNKGMVMRAVEYNGRWTIVSRDCKCMMVRRCIKRMKKSGLKDIIHDYTFDKYEATDEWQKKIKAAAMEYAENPDGWFFIGGQSGAGKTHICTAICREFLLGGKEVIYMLWRDDSGKIKSVANDAEKREELLDRFKKAEVLYIDDLFKAGRGPDGAKQRPTGADVNVAYEILNFRYNEKMPTIVSSECTTDDILDIDEATGGRIFERAKAFDLMPDRSRNYRLKGVTEL